MRKLKTREYEKDSRIAGKFNGLPLAIARPVTKEVHPKESVHYHQKATEFYIFLRGKAEMQVNNELVQVSAGDVLVIEPGEKHKISKIIEEVDYITIRDTVEEDKIVENPALE